MRISDWSSDVCSSDLLSTIAFATLAPKYRNEGTAMFTLIRNIGSSIGISVLQAMTIRNAATVHSRLVETVRPDQIGRASCRERVCQYVELSLVSDSLKKQ